MKEHPILFSAPMVRAILEGRKTQTRRVIKPQPEAGADLGFLIPRPNASGSCAHFHSIDERGVHSKELTVHCPYGQPGDMLWVRETWARDDEDGLILFRADNNDETKNWDQLRADSGLSKYNWKPSIHMPRRICRVELEITGIRVERLNEISGADCLAEGIDASSAPQTVFGYHEAYRDLWELINGYGSWIKNPWVWVVEFKKGGAE